MDLTSRQQAVLGGLGAVVLAAFVTLLVVWSGDDGGEEVTAGSTTSSSSTTSSTTTSTTSTTVPPSTTTSAPSPSTAPATTVVFPVVTGEGAVLRAPAVTDTRVMTGGCETLAHTGWSATCGVVAAKGAQLAWLIETQATPTGGTGRRAHVFRRTTGNEWRVILEVRDDTGGRFEGITARALDLSGDGLGDIAFGFRLTTGDDVLSVDVVEGPGNVVVHRDLTRGAARVSSGQLDTWRRIDASRFAHEVIQVRDGAWRIVSASNVPAAEVPPSQL